MNGQDLAKVYEWRQAQAVRLGSECFALAALILAPLLAAVLDDRQIEPWHLLAYASGALLAALSGLLWHRRARQFQDEFAERTPNETGQSPHEAGEEVLRW